MTPVMLKPSPGTYRKKFLVKTGPFVEGGLMKKGHGLTSPVTASSVFVGLGSTPQVIGDDSLTVPALPHFQCRGRVGTDLCPTVLRSIFVVSRKTTHSLVL